MLYFLFQDSSIFCNLNIDHSNQQLEQIFVVSHLAPNSASSGTHWSSLQSCDAIDLLPNIGKHARYYDWDSLMVASRTVIRGRLP